MDGSTRKEVAKPQGEEEKGQAQQKGERERETRMTTGRKGREVSYTIASDWLARTHVAKDRVVNDSSTLFMPWRQ